MGEVAEVDAVVEVVVDAEGVAGVDEAEEVPEAEDDANAQTCKDSDSKTELDILSDSLARRQEESPHKLFYIPMHLSLPTLFSMVDLERFGFLKYFLIHLEMLLCCILNDAHVRVVICLFHKSVCLDPYFYHVKICE